jgi:hypothetical protein
MEVMKHKCGGLATLQHQAIPLSILEKLKNKNESTVCFSNVNASQKARTWLTMNHSAMQILSILKQTGLQKSQRKILPGV